MEEDINRTDEELFWSFLSGQETAFAVLVDRYQKSLLGFIYKIVGNREKAEEIFQETFLRVFRFRETFQKGKKFKTWLYTIGLHLCRDEIKKKKSPSPISQLNKEGQDAFFSLESPPEEEAVEEELSCLIEEALSSLSDKHREVLILHHFQNLKYEEISEILNRKIGTIKSQLHYALQSLRSYLEPRLNEREKETFYKNQTNSKRGFSH